MPAGAWGQGLCNLLFRVSQSAFVFHNLSSSGWHPGDYILGLQSIFPYLSASSLLLPEE